jgi:hypothetical protein
LNIKSKVHLIRKTIHIGLAVLILLSSSGLIVNKHFCQNILVDTSFYVEATSCHEETQSLSVPKTSHDCDEEFEATDCCKDVSNLLKIETEQQIEVTDIQFPKIEINSDFQLISAQYAYLTEAHNQGRYKYASPLLVYDIFIDLQSFLC